MFGFDKKNNKYKVKRGYITLISMLVIGAVGLSVMMANILSSVGETKTSVVLNEFQKAKSVAEACVEESLGKIWLDGTYEGSGNINFSDADCSYTVTSISIPKTISITSSSGSVTKNILITVDQITPYVTISSWQEN